MELSLVVVNHGAARDVARLLDSLAAHVPSCRYEVIVVNTTSDGAYELREQDRETRVVAMPENRGFGAAVNTGAALARGEFIMPMNADLTVRDDCLPQMVTHMREQPTVGVLVPRLLSPDGSLQYNARTFYSAWTIICRRTPLGRLFPGVGQRHLYRTKNHDEIFAPDWGLGAALVVRREMMQDERIYDERFFLYFEDVDLCARAWQMGFRVEYFPPATLMHDHQRASAQSPFGVRGRTHLRSLRLFREKYGTLQPVRNV